MKQNFTLLFATLALISGGTGIVSTTWAQDPSFSQFYASRLYLNPAFAGLEEGLSFSAAMRQQWRNVPTGFQTYMAAVDIQEPNINSAFGLLVNRDVEGAGALTTTNVSFTYAYLIPIKDNVNIHIGLQPGWIEKSIDFSQLVFSDQLDAVLGNVRPTLANPVDRVGFFDMAAGIAVRFNNRMKTGETMRTSIGLSAHHLTEARESFQGLPTRLPTRYTFHAGMVIPVVRFGAKRETISWSPNIKYDLQDHIQIFSYGFYTLYDDVYMGVFYSNKHPLLDISNTNSLTFTIGAQVPLGETKCAFAYSYDANISGFGSRGGGTHELSLQFRIVGASMFGLNGSAGGGSGGGGLFGVGGKLRGGRGRWLNCFSFF